MMSTLPPKRIYCILTERDVRDWKHSTGSLVHESPGHHDMHNMLERADKLGDTYGQLLICEVVPIGTAAEIRDAEKRDMERSRGTTTTASTSDEPVSLKVEHVQPHDVTDVLRAEQGVDAMADDGLKPFVPTIKALRELAKKKLTILHESRTMKPGQSASFSMRIKEAEGFYEGTCHHYELTLPLKRDAGVANMAMQVLAERRVLDLVLRQVLGDEFQAAFKNKR